MVGISDCLEVLEKSLCHGIDDIFRKFLPYSEDRLDCYGLNRLVLSAVCISRDDFLREEGVLGDELIPYLAVDGNEYKILKGADILN